MRQGRFDDHILVAITLLIAAVFIYAGAAKINDPLQFADSIFAFAMLPMVFINPLALSLPLFELACGLLLILPWTRRIGSLAVALISLFFFTALFSALVRGLTLDCGCFGTGTPSRARMWVELGLDVLLFTGATWLYIRSIARSSERRT